VQQEAIAANMPDQLESWMKSRGIEPAGFKRLIDELRNMRREKWYDKLRRLVGTKMAARESRHTRKRPSRRHGAPHAGRIRMRKGMLAVAVDTSGSIAKTELTVFISKLAGIAQAYEAPFEVIVCDADIHAIKKITKKRDVATVDLTGGGGTSSKPVFEYLEKHKVDMLVYLTDLYIDFPEEPPRYKVLWGVINRGKETDFQPAPFGETYHLDIEENPEAMAPSPRKKR
jgi:predicted metal-dependent peptidase